MVRVYEGGLDAPTRFFAVVVSRFNEMYTERLLEGALEELRRAGVADEAVQVYWVPGAFEIPVVVKHLCQQKQTSAVIALGCVIRGETPHFDYVCNAAVDGIASVARETGVPVTNGIITADTVEQALARSGSEHRNLGAHAARAAVQMANLVARL